MMRSRFGSVVVLAAVSVLGVTRARPAAAATIVVTPGEQNTQSGENGCALSMATCAAGHWWHYPELLQKSLGAAYTVQNNGDGGAVLGCDAASAQAAGGGSFCKSSQYNASIAQPPGIVIIGPFGEHDQRIVTASPANQTAFYQQSAFEAAYEGLVQDYLKYTTKIYVMTPIDVPWGGTTALPAGEDLVKDIMLPAALKVAANHNLTVIDTYTAISGTADLIKMYYGTDGQVNQAGQQKMADLIETALAAPSGGTGGAGGAGGSAGASVGGSGGAAGASTAGAGGTGGSPSAGGAASVAGAPGTGGQVSGTAGATQTGSAGAGQPIETNDSSSGSSCAVSRVGGNSGSWFWLGALGGAFALLRRRRSR